MTPLVEIRPMSEDDDWEALSLGHPLTWLFPFWKSLTGIEIAWFTGLLDGRPVGLAAACPLPFATGGYGVGAVGVRPEARRQGVGTALFEAAVDVVRGRVPGIQLNHAADSADGAAAAATGVRIEPLPPLADIDDEAWHDLYVFVDARYKESPDAVGGDGLPYDEFRAMVKQPWMLATARDESGDYLGVTLVMDHRAKRTARTPSSPGVVAEARGRGIASALKCHQALLMADQGLTSLTTQNMEGNAPILAANRTLGFVPDFVYVDVVRDL